MAWSEMSHSDWSKYYRNPANAGFSFSGGGLILAGPGKRHLSISCITCTFGYVTKCLILDNGPHPISRVAS